MAMRPRGGGASSSRLGRITTVRPVYETFRPVFERQKEEEAEKLLIYLPGFLKENIRVSTEGKKTLKVRGERLIAANKWNLFLEEFPAPEDCNMGGIHARFENGILTITMPITKKIPPPGTLVTTKQEEPTQKPQTPPQKTTQDGDHFPPLPPQTTTDEIQKQPPVQPKPPVKSGDQVDNFPPKISQPTTPIQPKPLKGDQDEDDDDGFPNKTVRSSIESQKQATPAKTPLEGDDEDNQKETTPPKAAFQNGTDGVNSVESQKKPALRPMFIKDYEDESPPKAAPSVLAGGAKQGDQKRLEDQEKVSGGGQKMKPLIGLKGFVEGEKSSEVKAKGIVTQTFDGRNSTSAEEVRTGLGKDKQKEQSNKQSSMISGGGGDFRMENYKQLAGVKGVGDLKEERQLLVNAGVAVLVILALGAHIYNTVGTRKSD